MLIAIKEKTCRSVPELLRAYSSLLGGETTFVGDSHCVDLRDGVGSPGRRNAVSSSGIMFALRDVYLDIQSLHVTQNRRGQKLSTAMLALLLNYAKAQHIAKICVYSVNDSFWQHIQEKYKQFT